MKAKKVPLPARFRVKISHLESGVAFCDALITFAGQIPETVYQRAEIRVFKSLEQELSRQLEAARKEAQERANTLVA